MPPRQHSGGDGGVAAREQKRRLGSVNVRIPGAAKIVLHAVAHYEQRSVSAIASDAIIAFLRDWLLARKKEPNP
jgi:hypothetical protein